jgi:hypothetical protein
MLQAQLNGKLVRREEEMEDLLTSNVFGSLKYSLPNDGLSELMASSQNINGNNTFSEDITEASYEFWPQLREEGCNPCEPDVLITTKSKGGRVVTILVESKYLSGKSSFADDSKLPMDQLAREWHNLIIRAHVNEESEPVLLYVTADIDFPIDAVKESQRELQLKGQPEMNLVWLSWRRIPTIFSKAREGTILADLVKLLRRQGLTFYEGNLKVNPIVIKWSFKVQSTFGWHYDFSNLGWQFGNKQNFNWRFNNRALGWRFGE